MEGIASAKKKGVYTGRKKTIKPEEVQALKAEGLGITEIAN
jgi:DNA invertase Pin-like site-specific DNA recombinase